MCKGVLKNMFSGCDFSWKRGNGKTLTSFARGVSHYRDQGETFASLTRGDMHCVHSGSRTLRVLGKTERREDEKTGRQYRITERTK